MLQGGVRSAICTLVAVAALLAAVSAGARARLPTPIVGCWRHAAPAVQGLSAGVWTMRIEPGGLLVAYTPGRTCSGAAFSAVVAVKENVLRMKVFPDCGPKTALYTWAASAAKLTLRPVADTCAWGSKLFTGVWTRTGA
jgi:hypothetical protein